MAAIHRSLKPSISLNSNSQHNEMNDTTDQLPKQFVIAMKTLFEIMDDNRTGYVKLTDIENRWQDDGSKGLPRGVIECLRKVTPLNGLLTFERFCAGLKICLLRNQIDDNYNIKEPIQQQRSPSAPLLDLDRNTTKSQWNTATVRPNNAALPAQRTLSLPQLNPEDDDPDLILQPVSPVSPIMYAPPKPPRVGLERTSNSNNNSGGSGNMGDRFDRAEIRNALQNWQMGVIMNNLDAKSSSITNRGPGDGETSDNQQNGLTQKKNSNRRREPRRHTLQNGIDYNMLKRLKQFEQEKDVLIQGLKAVDCAREWYLNQITKVQEKMQYLGRMGSHIEPWSESQKERLDLQRARVVEVNRHLSTLTESWERGGFPMHMNLALRQSEVLDLYSQDIVNRLKQQNRQLTEEVSKKSDKITILEREKTSLLRDMVKIQRSRPMDNGILTIDTVLSDIV